MKSLESSHIYNSTLADVEYTFSNKLHEQWINIDQY